MAESANISPSNDAAYEQTSIGRQAIRVFRAARRRRLALPAEQQPRLSPGLVAELVARGWDVPPELRPDEQEATSDETDSVAAI